MMVSVIIPCYNAERWIRDALTSVIEQDVQLEIIVIDDGSTDGSAKIVQSEFPTVKLIRTTNGGPSRARNVGIALAQGSYIQFLDADDTLPTNKIAIQINALKQAGAQVAYSDWQYIRLQKDGQIVFSPILSRIMTGSPEIALLTDFWYPIHSYLFTNDIVHKTGGFNERLPIIQDARFAHDCALHGATFAYAPGPVIQYLMHSTTQNSKRDSVAFMRDCFTNASEVESWWRGNGGINAQRRKVLLRVYQQVARGTFDRDPKTFYAAYQRLRDLEPNFLPSGPRALRLLSICLGYPRAEQVASYYRSCKLRIQRESA